MPLLAAFILWMVLSSFVLVAVATAGAAEVKPLVSYEFSFGSQDYVSHSGAGGVSVKFSRKLRFSAFYSLLTDNDYSALHTGTLRVKSFVLPDADLSAGFNFSRGGFKDSNDHLVLTSVDFKGTKYFKNNFEGTAGYRFTYGTLSSVVQREVVLTRGRGTEIGIVEDGFTSSYDAHTLTAAAGYDFWERVRGLLAELKGSVTFVSTGASSFSESLEVTYLFPRSFTGGAFLTLTQHTRDVSRRYSGFFVAKQF